MIDLFNKDFEAFESRFTTFFSKINLKSLLKECGVNKIKGIDAFLVFKFIFSTIFTGLSLLRREKEEDDAPSKNTVSRFMTSCKADWSKLTCRVSAAINSIFLSSVHEAEDKKKERTFRSFIVDDSPYLRNKSNKVELLARNFDHANHSYFKGFRMLTLGYSDGYSFLPVSSCCMSSGNEKNVLNKADETIKPGTPADRRRKLAIEEMPAATIALIDEAKENGLSADYVLMDSWFICPKMIRALTTRGYNVCGMVKKSKTKYSIEGKEKTLTQIFKENRKKRGRSRYLLSVVVKIKDDDGNDLELKLVYVRNRANRKEWLCILSTDTTLTEDEVIACYSERWAIETFFKFSKQKLQIVKRCNAISYDAICANNAIAFIQYAMLELERRLSNDNRTLGELFVDMLVDGDQDKIAAAVSVFLSMFADELVESMHLQADTVEKLLNEFCTKLPELFSKRFKNCA